MRYRLLSLFLVLAMMTSLIHAQEANQVDSCVDEFEETVDYFPDKADVDHATGFSVEYHNNYKVVELVPWVAAETTFTYVLVQCGTPAPEDVEADAIIEVPVESIITMSTTILPHLATQGVVDRLVGVDTLLYTSTESVLERADEIVEVGGEFAGINTELILDTEPALIMAQQFSSAGTALDTLTTTGIEVVLNSDFTDTSPLGQAEWGKYVALYFNTETAANETFAEIEAQYNDLLKLTAEIDGEERPTVIAASPFQGTWYMPAGDSYLAQLIADAGGHFLFDDQGGTSIAIDFEVVLDEGSTADYWVNISQTWRTTEDMLADDPRYSEFAAFENGNLWNNNLRQNANGGVDYYENGIANPQLLLADMIAILHPDLLPDHEFEFYQPLTAGE